MKRLFTLLAATLSVMPISFAQKTGKLDLVVLSDTHVMAPELLQERGAAYDNYIANDRKLLSESPEILMSAVDRILSNPPDAVLVTGDMTKDGEVESHALVSQVLLKPLRDAGIRVFVTPGNHDIRNPHAVRFLGDSTVRTKTVSAEEFAEFYKDYGYGDAIARDPHSLSYVAQLDESTRLLSVDACMYEDNDFELDICVTDGRIKPETMDFIREQVGKAEKDGCRIVTMMHHGLIRHWKWQNIAMPEYLVRNWRKNARIFGRLGLNIVFTGHFHAQDIISFGSGRRRVYDIETGSTVSYPLPMRRVTLDGNRLSVRSELLTDGALDPALPSKARDYAYKVIASLVDMIVPDSIPQDILREVSEVMGEAYAANIAGDEAMPDEYVLRLKAVVRKVRPHSFKYAFILDHLARNLYTDPGVADNNVELTLEP